MNKREWFHTSHHNDHLDEAVPSSLASPKKHFSLKHFAHPEPVKIKTSAADIDSLMGCLFTIDTLLIGFVITFIGNVQYMALLETDAQFATGVWKDWDHGFFYGKQNEVFIYSQLLNYRSLTALTTLAISLFLAIGTSIGLNCSNCREDEKTFTAWLSVFQWVICSAYILFLVGLIFSFSSVTLASMGNYPKYCNVRVSPFGAWGNFNLISPDGTLREGCLYESMTRQGAINIFAINWLAPVIIISSLFVSVYVLRARQFVLGLFGATNHEDVVPDAKETDQSVRNSSFPRLKAGMKLCDACRGTVGEKCIICPHCQYEFLLVTSPSH